MSYVGTMFAKRLSLRLAGGLLAVLMAASTLTSAQGTAASSVVPNVVNYSGTLIDADGKPLTRISGVTFSLYRDAEGGAALWIETQNVQPDNRGHYAAKLGSASGQGLPADLFASGEARWLGVQIEGQAEQPRVLLLSVPYALKAADAETLGGMPVSAFALANSRNATGAGVAGGNAAKNQSGHEEEPQKATTKAVKTPTPFGTINAIPLWVDTNEIGNSIMSQSGTDLSVAGGLSSSTFVTSLQGLFGNAGGSNAVVGTNNGAGFSAVGAINNNVSALSYGVTGQSMSKLGIGVLGFGSTFSNTFNTTIGRENYGVVGDGANVSGVIPIGVYGSADAGVAVAGENSSSSQPAGLFVNFDTTTGDVAFEAEGTKGHCTIDTKGDLACTGSKSAVVTLPDSRWVRLYAVESPDNWFEDFGSGSLSNGTAAVMLDPTFAQTVNTNVEYHVFITPKGESEGLYVANETPQGFEVREQHGGHSSIAFDYRIVGRRLGYENIRLEDVTERQNQIAARQQTIMSHDGNAIPLPAQAQEK